MGESEFCAIRRPILSDQVGKKLMLTDRRVGRRPILSDQDKEICILCDRCVGSKGILTDQGVEISHFD